MSKRCLDRPERPVYPSPAALITSVDPEGRPNVLTLAEVFNVSISRPVILGIAIRQATYSYGLIVSCKEFVVNFPGLEILKQVDQVGSISGRECPDKFSAYGLSPLPAREVKPPLIAECPVNVECRVRLDLEVGDHHLILGDAVAMHVDEDKLSLDGQPDPKKLGFLSYVFGQYWSAGRLVGDHGFSRRDGRR